MLFSLGPGNGLSAEEAAKKLAQQAQDKITAEVNKRQASPSSRYRDVLAGQCYLSLQDSNARKQTRSPNTPPSPELFVAEEIPDGGLREMLLRHSVGKEEFVGGIKTVPSSLPGGGTSCKIRFSALADALKRILSATTVECESVWAALETSGKAGMIPRQRLIHVLGMEVCTEETPAVVYRGKQNGHDEKDSKSGSRRRGGGGRNENENEEDHGEQDADYCIERSGRSRGSNEKGAVSGVRANDSPPAPLSSSALEGLHSLSREDLEARLVGYMEEEKGRHEEAGMIEGFVARLEEATKLVKSLNQEKKEALKKVKELTVKLERAQSKR